MELSYQVERFNLVYDTLIKSPDTPVPHMANISRQDAISVTKAHMATQGVELRGARFTGTDEVGTYLILQGEYGYMVLCPSTGSDKVTMEVSNSYRFTDADSGAQVQHMLDLVKVSTLIDMKVPMLLQWFDSVYRMIGGRRVSPHFRPEGTAVKLINTVVTGLPTLIKLNDINVMVAREKIELKNRAWEIMRGISGHQSGCKGQPK